MKIKIVLIFCLSLGAFAPAFGFNLHPEYRGISELEVADFDQPHEIDGEYESDFTTYLPSIHDIAQFYSASGGLLASAGSLDAKHFQFLTAVQWTSPMTDRLDFSFRHLRQDDFENHDHASVFELTAWNAQRHHGWALYGDVQYEKKHDDVGAAYIYKPTPEQMVRASLSWPEFSRNDRNASTDRLTKSPFTASFVYRTHSAQGEFFEYGVQWQSPTEWRRPDEGRYYSYERRNLFLTERRLLRERDFVNWRLEYDRKYERQTEIAGSSGVDAESWRRDRLRAQLEYETSRWIYGTWVAWRDWKLNGQDLQLTLLQPYVGSIFKKTDSSEWSARYLVITADADVDSAWPQGNHPESRVDHRWNLMWRFNFSKGSLSAQATFDIDDLTQSEAWEGGHMQFLSRF